MSATSEMNKQRRGKWPVRWFLRAQNWKKEKDHLIKDMCEIKKKNKKKRFVLAELYKVELKNVKEELKQAL